MFLKILKIIVPTVVLAVAIFVGWLNTKRFPEGTLFSMIYPISKGYLPPVFTGGYKECPVLPLPQDDKTLEPRPSQETFVTLPGYVPPIPTAEEVPPVDPNLKKYRIPQQGIGMCCRHTAYDPESVRRTILWYLQLGGRHIDTADVYLNQEWIGEALQIAMKEYKIPRDEIWVTTKLWPGSYGTNTTLEAIPRMLKELQLDYIDLVLLHATREPMPFLGPKSSCAQEKLDPKECRLETWKALSTFTKSGLVRHIGVSNFNVRHMKEIMELDNVAPIANNQILYNPWVRDEWHEAFRFCQEQGISVTAYSTFLGAMMQSAQAFSVETLQRIAKNHDTSVPQVLLRWAMQKGAIVIPGTGNPKHMKENLKAYELVLTDQELQEITNLGSDESAKQFFKGMVDES